MPLLSSSTHRKQGVQSRPTTPRQVWTYGTHFGVGGADNDCVSFAVAYNRSPAALQAQDLNAQVSPLVQNPGADVFTD
jgi:hypothetical protein